MDRKLPHQRFDISDNHRTAEISLGNISTDGRQVLVEKGVMMLRNMVEDWLNIAVTPKARTKIRQSLNEQEMKVSTFAKEALERKFKNKLNALSTLNS